nr:G protein-coupled receptor [Proales similis]
MLVNRAPNRPRLLASLIVVWSLVTSVCECVSNLDPDTSKLQVDYCESCDIYIGGLFPVHAPKYMREDTGENAEPKEAETYADHFMSRYFLNEVGCGEIKKERGIQRLEAMLFAIDLINNRSDLLPNLKLGTKIYDTCDRDTIALDRTIKFIGDYYLMNEEKLEQDFVCASGRQVTKNVKRINQRRVIGVIGAASSSVSVQVANLLRIFKVPQISYASTSPELSNKERFPYFSRVLPSDKLQAEAMATLVHHLGWNYVITLSEEGNLGGIDTFMTNLKGKKVCIAGSYTISQTASEDYVAEILREMRKDRARGVVMFLQDHNIRKLLKLVKRLNMTGHFLWVASDGWGTKQESINSNDQAAEGAITFLPKSYEIKEFNDYFKRLRPATNKRNPWFVEYWEEQFNCTLGATAETSSLRQKRLRRVQCSGEEELNFAQDGFIHFVIDSVFAMAHAIQDLADQHCSNLLGQQLLNCLHNKPIAGPGLLLAIRNVEFISITGRQVQFSKDRENMGDGLAPFEIFQYQQDQSGRFGYTKISEWEKNKPFDLNMSQLKWPDGVVPKSVCRDECGVGEIKQGDVCCWVCVKCDENEYVSVDGSRCIPCPQGYGPDANRTACVRLEIEYLKFNSPFTIVPLIFSLIGIIFTSFCIYVFIRYNDTPIIKASGRELCYMLLAGIMMCYLITIPLVTKPTVPSCYMLRFGVSLSLTICLSALFTKTNRLSRIFNSSLKKARQASYVSPKSQLVICSSIISVQLVGIIVWTVLTPPDIRYDFNDPQRVILECNSQYVHLAVSFVYNMFLVVLCTIYAIKTRKIPENFNEARFIGFTMYSICIIWTAFIPIYFGTTAAAGSSKYPKNNYKIQLTTMAMCLNLSAYVILFCLFLPKLRVVLLKPNKNIRSKSGNLAKAVASRQLSKYNTNMTSPTVIEKSYTTRVSSGSLTGSPVNHHARKMTLVKDENNNNSTRVSMQEASSFGCRLETVECSRSDAEEMLELTQLESVKETATDSGAVESQPLVDERYDEKKSCGLKIRNSISLTENVVYADVSEADNDDYDDCLLTDEETIKRIKSKNLKSIRIAFSRSSSEDNTCYYYLSFNPKQEATCRPAVAGTSTSISLSSSTMVGNEDQATGLKAKVNRLRGASLERELVLKRDELAQAEADSSVTGVSEQVSDELIKKVVQRCFEQISKNKDLSNHCVLIKRGAEEAADSCSEQQIKFVNVTKLAEKGVSSFDQAEAELRAKVQTRAELKPSTSGSLSSLSSVSLSIENPYLKQMVAKKASELNTAPVNTVLFNQTNHLNDLYSLKITFV